MDVNTLAWSVLLLPLIVAATILLGLKRWSGLSSLVSTGSALITLIFCIILAGDGDKAVETASYPWINLGDGAPGETFRIDGDKKVKISGLVDSEAFLQTLSTRPAAKAYIYGHSHTWLLKQEPDGLHEINLPPTAYVFDKARPSGWVRATISKTGLSLELRSIDPAHAEHGQLKTLTWR